jgi:apolipoprotein N-acyltransferase
MADSRRGLLSCGMAALAGVALTGAFAPLGYWPLALLSPAVLLWLWRDAPTPRAAAWLGFWFSVGTFSVGTWWLYISIHGYGQAPAWLALLLMGGLVLLMAGWQALLGWSLWRWLPRHNGVGTLLAMPAAWVLIEWLRGWMFSGFPWLSLGYSQTDSPLAGIAPLAGVYGISAAVLLSAAGLVTLVRAQGRLRVVAAACAVLPWVTGAALQHVEWTQIRGGTVSVALVQGAVPQDLKWQAEHRDNTLTLYRGLNQQALGARLVVWPEAALPGVANGLGRYLAEVWAEARAAESALLIGAVRTDDSGRDYFNSLLALGSGEPAVYDKQHLVPYGEYFPVPDFVRLWLQRMDMPFSDLVPGAAGQPPLSVAGLKVAASICYEDAYGELLRSAEREADLLVNVTNDAWFGTGSARYQHLQIARMRALESGRDLLRVANDGVSAVVDYRGRVLQQAPEFTPAVLRGQVQPRQGLTPWLAAGDTPVLALASLLVAGLAWWQARVRRRS